METVFYSRVSDYLKNDSKIEVHFNHASLLDLILSSILTDENDDIGKESVNF